MVAKPVPDGYHTVTPYINVSDLPGQLTFLEKAFNAQRVRVTRHPDGVVGHAEVKIGDSMLMFAQATEMHPAATASLYLYLPDVDASYQQALDAGAVSVMEPANQFYGDRNCGVTDPAGNIWWLGTHLEDLTEAEITERMKAQYPTASV